MDNKITLEFLKKARATESAEALVSLAKESGIELTEEQAAETYEVLHPQGVAISDDELGSVSGGYLPDCLYSKRGSSSPKVFLQLRNEIPTFEEVRRMMDDEDKRD